MDATRDRRSDRPFKVMVPTGVCQHGTCDVTWKAALSPSGALAEAERLSRATGLGCSFRKCDDGGHLFRIFVSHARLFELRRQLRDARSVRVVCNDCNANLV